MLIFQILSVVFIILALLMYVLYIRAKSSLAKCRLELMEATSKLDKNEQQLLDLNQKYKPVIDIDLELKEREVDIQRVQNDLSELRQKYSSSHQLFKALEKEVSLYRNELDVMEFGLYQPQFDYQTSEEFKDHLDKNYQMQKECVKSEGAIKCDTNWIVEGSTAKGKQMTRKYSKLMLYAFNGECDSLIAKVKWNNATRSKERILKSFQSINKLGESHQIEITTKYLDLKLQELALSHEYENKKFEEKEEQRRIREQMREEEKAQKEFERAEKAADEEERRYQRALQRAKSELETASVSEIGILNEQIQLLETKLAEAHDRKERAISMAQLTKVGHIYVISNLGSFGVDVYKIGMTRRLEPMDRIRELGDASVPFQFDVHAIIYSENAPQLEYELHKKFQDRRLNRINGRKEFFKVTLDEIETFVNAHAGAEIEFTKLAEAKEYRETLAMLERLLTPEEHLDKVELFPSNLD